MKTTEALLTSEATTDVINVIPASCGPLRRQLRKFGSLAFSTVLHTGILLVMAFRLLPATIVSRHLELNAIFDVDEGVDEGDVPVEFLLHDETASHIPREYEFSMPILETTRDSTDFDVALFRPDPALIEPQLLAPVTVSPDSSVDVSFAVYSIEEAVERIAGSIQSKLQAADLLVVWLVDSSESLANDRKRVATQLESFLQGIVSDASSHQLLLNAVVSFGAATRERVAPTEVHDSIVNSIGQLPVDYSGKEDVFAAVQQCVKRYRRKWLDARIMIVVWTDESGDDVAKLEDTIRICEDQAVSVSVVGPSAVLGADTGLYSVRDPGSRQVRQLPINRGPDSALPERLQLGYWFLTQEPPSEFVLGRDFGSTEVPLWYGQDDRNVPDYKCVAATEVPLPAWYGGRDLLGLVSGFSPYALTRLTSQTGGTYIIHNRDNERGPFPADAMRAYLPDYRSMEEYLHDVHSHPLRQAVMKAVEVTQGAKLGPPPTILFGRMSESPPYGFMRDYFTPAEFVSVYRSRIRRLKVQAGRTTRVVEQALAHVSQPGDIRNGLQSEYEVEHSRRWRAWYDLTRGRLLATSVRLEEYRRTCNLVVKPGFLNATTNHLIFVPTLKMKSNSDFHHRAEESERLLSRCVRENPNTPWALLAQRELDYGLGINVRQHTLSRFVMPPSMGQQYLPPKL